MVWQNLNEEIIGLGRIVGKNMMKKVTWKKKKKIVGLLQIVGEI